MPSRSVTEAESLARRPRSPVASLKRRLRVQAEVLLGCAALMWGVRAADAWLVSAPLTDLGIRPRQAWGLLGVPLAPWIHADWRHLLANTPPFLVLGWLTLLRGIRGFWTVSLSVAMISGLGVWLTGQSGSVHVGASGVIFGYLGFLLGRAYFERSLISLLVAGLAGLLYGGLIWSVIPSEEQVSWQGHLFGFVGGVLCGHVLATPPRRLWDRPARRPRRRN